MATGECSTRILYDNGVDDVDIENICNDFNEDLDIENICNGLNDHERVVIQKSTVIVVTPQSQRSLRKRKNIEEESDSEESPAEPPKIGMLFSSWMEVEILYKKYGKQEGFGITKVQGTKSKDKSHRRSMTWRCECWGDPEMRLKKNSQKRLRDMDIGGSAVLDEGSKRKRKSKKCFCPAKVYASINRNEVWEIKDVILDHENHTPQPGQAKLVKEYRMQSFHTGVRRRLLDSTDVGISIPQLHDTMARERDGVQNMPFNEQDMRHVVDKERRLKMEGGDANALANYFEKMQRQNLNFFHAYRLDENGSFKDVVWVDARSQAAYEEFGDAICFDSTYLTNEYDLPFANFVGVNHHGQSILLGCALISKEDCDTFTWLFSQWLLCMKGKAPRAILTDQAAAMRGPLAEAMPDTRHRWCIWHILQKLPKKFGKDERYENIKEDLLRAIYDSFTVGEFESAWDEVISKYALQSNEWLANLFDERHMWVPTFMKDVFWAGMRTTQRVESINSFFDKFIRRHTRLCEFGEKYCAAVERRVCQEQDADSRDVKWIRNISTGFQIEKVFRKIYTDAKFRVVQRECERLMYCFVREEKEVGPNKYMFLLEDRVWVLPKGCQEEVIIDKRRMYCVHFDSETKDAVCDCRKFETEGILCRHMIRVLDQNFVNLIPEKYILRRWRKDVTRKYSSISVAYHDHSKTLRVKRLDKINVAMEPIFDLACGYDETTSIVLRGVRKLKKEVNEWLSHKSSDEEPQTQDKTLTTSSDANLQTQSSIGANKTPSSTPNKNSPTNPPSSSTARQYNIKDPPIPKRGRGRTKSNRFKAIGEPGWKKANSGSQNKNKSNTASNAKGTRNSQNQKASKSQKGGTKTKKTKKDETKKKAVALATRSEPNNECLNIEEDDLLNRNSIIFEQ